MTNSIIYKLKKNKNKKKQYNKIQIKDSPNRQTIKPLKKKFCFH